MKQLLLLCLQIPTDITGLSQQSAALTPSELPPCWHGWAASCPPSSLPANQELWCPALHRVPSFRLLSACWTQPVLDMCSLAALNQGPCDSGERHKAGMM